MNVIKVENLSKQYAIGERQKHYSFREMLAEQFQAPFRWIKHRGRIKKHVQRIWALRDVSFEVKQGEVVGIIGRNGSGKSTLLKILSRITDPTRGRAEIHGRVASLLEVGTGFHPELTGRENIYLNGTILGMKRWEITKKFDEIVAFAEIKKFIDTPVKRYSSGMCVRLAFAVAAHLNPEILLVDEVLAVGDAEFQKKCLGKMSEAGKKGQTVLFVSHNVMAVQALCQKALWITDGKLFRQGKTEEILRDYQQSVVGDSTTVPLKERKDREGQGSARTIDAVVSDADGNTAITPLSRLKIVIDYESQTPLTRPTFLIGVYDQNGIGFFYFDSSVSALLPKDLPQKGRVTCITEPIRLTPRSCLVNVAIMQDGANGVCLDYIRDVARFDIVAANSQGGGKLPPPHILSILNSNWLSESL